MRKKIFFLIDLLLAIVLIGLDQLTKYLALTRLKGNDAIVIIKNVLEIDYLENRGSAFGMFQNQKLFLLTVGFLFLAIVLFIMYRSPSNKRFLAFHLCLSGILAGGIGNMIDRFRFSFVVDFVSFVLIHFPVFNVADCYIVISVFVMMFLFLFIYKDDELSFLSFTKKEK